MIERKAAQPVKDENVARARRDRGASGGLRSVAALAVAFGLVAAVTAQQYEADRVLRVAPAASTLIDITSQALGGQNVTLSGDSVVNLPPGTTTYNGVLSGEGTLTVRAPNGPSTLVLSKDSDFTLPASRKHQVVTTTSGPHPHTPVANPDPPAIIVAAGATLWYGNGGSTGVIGHYPYNTPATRSTKTTSRSMERCTCRSSTATTTSARSAARVCFFSHATTGARWTWPERTPSAV